MRPKNNHNEILLKFHSSLFLQIYYISNSASVKL